MCVLFEFCSTFLSRRRVLRNQNDEPLILLGEINVPGWRVASQVQIQYALFWLQELQGLSRRRFLHQRQIS